MAGTLGGARGLTARAAVGAHFSCADGRRFLDTNSGGKSTCCGIDPAPVGRAVQARATGLRWKVQRLYPRSGASLSGRLARRAREADADEQPELNALLRLGLADRGVWDAISTAGPGLSVAAGEDDVAGYLEAFAEITAALAPPG